MEDNIFFISNAPGNTMQAFLEKELSKCEQFIISVAFISKSGLASLKQTLLELENRGIPGKILTTDYLTFTEPGALRSLSKYRNIEVKLFRCDKNIKGFHTKGYLFFKEKVISITIGSSNLTGNALAVNKEWNTCFSVEDDASLYKSVIEDFESLWNSSNAFPITEEILDEYTQIYIEQKRIARELQQQKIALEKDIVIRESKKISFDQILLEPNSMQLEFVRKLNEIRAMGEHRALLISATGTGKTYAAAFALREINPKRALFLVHREQILRKAIESFKNVFGDTKTFGLYSGTSHEIDRDFIFATMQTMATHFEDFAKQEFQVIVVDEAHRVGAESYQNMMAYFNPDLWIGMTASPDRTDKFDVYSAFDHNIAHEIRLQEAMRLNLLCPFHYYGITDIFVDGEEKDKRDFARLVCDERVDFIIKKAEYFDHSGNRVKGLAFCSTLEESKELSKKFNERGYRTIALSGADSQDTRENCVKQLEQDEWDGGLDYIFTVDIFNEGIDIPQVNQILMLRPTESPIIFVQQLGRGLRKAENKEFVMILDFIGNYSNNYMIPIALSGDRTYNKDNIRRYVRQGVKALEGASTIHFDEIARKRIYESIDSANFSEMKLIKECYKNLKYKLGRIPNLMDYEEYGEIDVMRIFENASLGSYHKFLKKVEKDEYKVDFSTIEEKYLEYVSTKFANGKRLHELLILDELLGGNNRNVMSRVMSKMQNNFGISVNEKTRKNVENILTGQFASGAAKDTYTDVTFIESNETDFCISSKFKDLLVNNEFRRQMTEVVKFGLFRNKKYFGHRYKDTSFCLYEKYTYEDVCRLLDWEKSEVSLNIGGYKYDKNTQTYPVFINYEKNDNISATTRYEDRFVNEGTLIAISKSGRTSKSEDVKAAIEADQRGIKMDLFVRKNKDDHTSKEFYYLGRLHATGSTIDFVMPETTKTAVEITYNLETPVRQDIYEYLVG
ncbi:Superfamily II DNA or RNA helicase [Fibrobacter sp. UWCM]|uniref:DEAD/DEAH box helicase n=1 Tax=Fibrobacter sp. UWCM TaxID=1896208 RepID=UPI00092293B5|nr:DEAD/DEAH box helicase [Fibrobacter sp. UWCM]SHG78718.1 Superfamily II DNA or RNA helicase [Fibrobacter sp. UWCM]